MNEQVWESSEMAKFMYWGQYISSALQTIYKFL